MNLTSKYHNICVPVRTLLFLIIFLTPEKYMNYWLSLAILSLIVVLYRFLTHSKNQKGGFGQAVKWQNMRIYHLLTILMFIVLMINKNYKLAKMIPLLDLLSVFFYTPSLN
jgi:hypothetical protein